jgi:hypothetical protein
MDARAEQRLIGIDIAHAAQERLIEEQRLNARAAVFEARLKIGERQGQGLRTETVEVTGIPFHSAELPDVVEEQEIPFQL